MDIMELGAIGELVGGVAVIGSLIYVGLQIRQSNRIETAESVRSSTRDYITAFHGVDPEIFVRGVNDFGEMSAADQQALHQQLVAVFFVTQAEFSLSQSGLSDRASFDNNAEVLAAFIRTPGLRQWWATAGPLLDNAFRSHLDDLVRDGAAGPSLRELLPWLAREPRAGVEV